MKTRRKQRREQALTETAAKVQLLDVDGKMVKELIFDDSSSDILDETSVGNKQGIDFGDLDEVSSQFNKLTLKDATSQTESKTKDSTTQTEEYDYMFENVKKKLLSTLKTCGMMTKYIFIPACLRFMFSIAYIMNTCAFI